MSGLAPVTVLTGKNGAGKTTVLEAVLALYGRMNPAWAINLQGLHGLNRWKANLGPNFLGLFYGYKDEGSAEIRGESGPEGDVRLVLERT